MTIRHTLALAALLAWLPLGNALAGGCAGQPRCYDAGPFTATVIGVVPSWGRNHKQQFLRLNLRISNTGAKPLILGFRWGSAASLIDNYGNAYRIDTRFPRMVVGLGLIRREGVDANFVVAPGGSRDASLIFNRWVGKSAIGNHFSADFSIEQLEPLPGGRQVREVGQYSLSFANLDGGMSGADPMAARDPAGDINKVLNLFKHKH